MSRPLRELDRPFLGTLLALLAIGLVVVYSACQGEDPTVADLWIRQIVFAVGGLVAFAACAAVPPAVWERLAPLLYVGAVAALVAVVLIGSSAGGATRWLSLGGLRFQPSEIAKFGACLLLARILAA
ncbi:MAG: FtsW/RodA/SpoVE family cell cycle protein, partial [bacterium]